MKKLLALMLALVMMLTASFALADTVTIDFDVNSDVLTKVMPVVNPGMPAEQMAQIQPIVDLVDKLSLKITAAGQAAQLDVNVGETNAIAIAGKGSEDGSIVVGSTIIPSYLFKITEDDIKQIVQQIAGQMPGGAATLLNPETLQKLAEKATAILMKDIPAFQAVIVPGTPESGSFSFEGYTFDTKTPITIDKKALCEAVKTLVTDIVSDQDIMGLISAVSGQGNLDPQTAINNVSQSMTEENMPDVKMDAYTSSTQPALFYGEGEVSVQGGTDPVNFKVLVREDNTAKFVADIPANNMTVNAEIGQNDILIELSGKEEGQYVAIHVTMEGESAIKLDVCLVEKTPVASIRISVEQGGGDVTVDLNEEGKTVLGLMEVLQDQTGEKLQGIQQEATAGLFKLMSIPEVSSLMAIITTTMR